MRRSAKTSTLRSRIFRRGHIQATRHLQKAIRKGRLFFDGHIIIPTENRGYAARLILSDYFFLSISISPAILKVLRLFIIYNCLTTWRGVHKVGQIFY
jgi:hypothetical protein